MTAREDREKEKFTKETVVKYFFDMSKSTYTIMVLGGLAALFGIVETKCHFVGRSVGCSLINYWLCNF